MPQLGEIKHGNELGHKSNDRYVWFACPECGRERWIITCQIKRNKYKGACHSCTTRRERAHNWKGGRRHQIEGYIIVKLFSNDEFFPMANKGGYVLEHRYLMAKHLGRCLLKSEQVHHINGVRDDNRRENLELISPTNHSLKTMYCNNCELKTEIRLLRWELKQLREQLQIKLFQGG